MPVVLEAQIQVLSRMGPPSQSSQSCCLEAGVGDGNVTKVPEAAYRKAGDKPNLLAHPIFLNIQSLLKIHTNTLWCCPSEQGLWTRTHAQASEPSFATLITNVIFNN